MEKERKNKTEKERKKERKKRACVVSRIIMCHIW